MLVYGQLVKAQLENLAADISPASDGLIYYNTVSLFPKYYNGAWRTFADTNSTQALTNKDYDGGTASNTSRFTMASATLATLQGLTRKAGSLWYATDTQRYYGDDGSNLSELGSGSGQGELNVIENPSAASAITGWVASGAGITVVRTTTLSDLPLSPIIDSAIKITPVSGTDFVYYRFTMPESLKNRRQKIAWYQRPVSGYLSGDLKVELYKNSASNYGGTYTEFVLDSDDSAGDSLIGNTASDFETQFTADNADYYELRIVRVAGTTALNIANVTVGPGLQPQGAIVTDWEPHTLVTDGMGTIVNPVVIKRRVGSNLQMKGYFYVGTISSVDAARIFLPTGLNVDISELSDTRSASFGVFKQLFSATTDLSGSTFEGNCTWAVGDTTSLALATQSSSQLFNVGPADTVIAFSTQISFEIDVPIAEWAGNGQVYLAANGVQYASNSDASDANDTMSFVFGPQGAAGVIQTTALTQTRRKRVRSLRPLSEVDVTLEVLDNGVWMRMTQVVPVTNAGIDTAYRDLWQYNAGGTATVGVGVEPVDEYHVDIAFGRFCVLRNDAGGAGGEWDQITSSTAWRVKFTSKNGALGFNLASETQSGIVAPYDTSQGVVYSGTWTPGILGSVNIDGVTNLFGKYTRVGNIVTCSFYGDVDANVTGNAYFDFTLPVPSNFAAATDMIGHGSNVFDKNVSIFGSPAPNTGRMSFTAVVLTATTWTGTFQYEVLP